MQKNILIKYEEIENLDVVSDLEKKIINKAISVADKAYASYSNFRVGVAVLLENDIIITGNNQENASFPCGICAERVAVFYAKSKYPDLLIKKIAITAKSEDFDISSPVGPCGLCRQVLVEYEENQRFDIEILLFNREKMIKLAKAKDLLPFYFHENKLKKL